MTCALDAQMFTQSVCVLACGVCEQQWSAQQHSSGMNGENQKISTQSK
jgi:hypothetical protein